ncbi:hypothetical protein GY45DRAFT_1229160, partial [Cubamyces sp. BRFM 1775]
MVECKLLARISESLSNATRSNTAFSGLSIILAGDFAQLPPVSERKLYVCFNTSQNASLTRGQDIVFGKLLWLSFTTVVILTEVMRQRGDLSFVDLLAGLRE